MDEGLIIKLYRERAGLTQAQLGKGICSVTHVSKIERGLTQCSKEIINLICERLNIDLQKELEQNELLEKKLHEWLEVMVKQQIADIELLKQEIEDNTFVHVSEAHHFYRILVARYFLLKGEIILVKCDDFSDVFFINKEKILEEIKALSDKCNLNVYPLW